MKKIVLASNSPRRRELVAMVWPEYEIAPALDIDESYPETLPAVDVPEYLSRLKAAAYKDSIDIDAILVTADTVVVVDGVILGKPHDRTDAIAMLRMLSGRKHSVITGVSLTHKETVYSFSETTEVEFGVLSDDEIAFYVDTYRPYDKAGAYGIQEWIGCVAIKGIKGCYYNVMGLPLHSLYRRINDIES